MKSLVKLLLYYYKSYMCCNLVVFLEVAEENRHHGILIDTAADRRFIPMKKNNIKGFQ